MLLPFLVGAAACGRDTAQLVLDPLGPSECLARCVDTLEVSLNGTKSSHPCGAPIALGTIGVGERVVLELTARGSGPPLNGRAEVIAASREQLQVDLQLEPSERPRIASAIAERTVLLGPTAVTLEGSGFGAEAQTVLFGDRTARISSWSDHEIVAVTEVTGPLAVVRCGIRSATAALALSPPRIEVLSPLPASCSAGRLRATTSIGTEGSRDGLFALFDCGTSSCGAGRVARLVPEQDALVDHWGPTASCPLDLSVDDQPTPFVSADPGLALCRLQGGHDLICQRRHEQRGTVRAVSALSAATAAFIVEPTPGIRQLWKSTPAGSQQLLPNMLSEVLALGRSLVLDGGAGTPRLMVADFASAMVRSLPLPGCHHPKLLEEHAPRTGAEHRAAVVCQENGASLVLSFELSAHPDAPVRTATVGDFLPDRAVSSADGRTLLLWSELGKLAFVDLDDGRVLGVLTLPPSYAGAALGRVPWSDHFFLGGPAPGQLTRISFPDP